METHNRRDWLIAHRDQLVNNQILDGDEIIERVERIGGFDCRNADDREQ